MGKMVSYVVASWVGCVCGREFGGRGDVGLVTLKRSVEVLRRGRAQVGMQVIVPLL